MKQQRDRKKAVRRLCRGCGLSYALLNNGTIYPHKGCPGSRKPPQPQPESELLAHQLTRARILSEFEMTLATQMARINTRLAQSERRVFGANAKTRDDGPFIAEGGTTLLYGGDNADVENKK